MANISKEQSAVVTLAKKQDLLGAGKNLCQKWVANVYNKSGVQSPRTSRCCARRACVDWKVSDSKTNIPLGATVYAGSKYDSKVRCSCGLDAGHVGIYVGDNTVAHNAGRIRLDTLDKFISSFGWGGWGWNGGQELGTGTDGSRTSILDIEGDISDGASTGIFEGAIGNVTLTSTIDDYEKAPYLSSQPYYAFAELTLGGYTLPSTPSDYIRNVTVQDLDAVGSVLNLVLFDQYDDEIEQTLIGSWNSDNYLRFGHVNGRQSKKLKFQVNNFTTTFEPSGTILTVACTTIGYELLTLQSTFDIGDNPSEAVKLICDKLGYQYDSTTIQDTIPIKDFHMINEYSMRYIVNEICPYAISASDGSTGYQFYVDSYTDPPTAYFHPININSSATKTYIYKRGLNTSVLSFSIDTTLFANSMYGVRNTTEASVLDPITKEETTIASSVNNRDIVSGDYTVKDENASVGDIDVSGMSYGEAVTNLSHRLKRDGSTDLQGTLTIIGDPTVQINNTIRIIVLTKHNKLHYSSGLYIVMGVTHTISSGIMITTLSVTKSGVNEIDGLEIKSYKSIYK